MPLLGGERKGLKIDGFDLGNSPAEYHLEKVKARSIVLTTTNGTKAIKLAKGCDRLHTCSLLDISAVAKAVVESGKDLLVICAGRGGRLSLEDTWCTGELVKRIGSLLGENKDLVLDDSAKTAVALSSLYPNPIDVLKASDHGQYLEQIGLGADLQICAEIDAYQNLIVFKDGFLTLA